MFYVFVILLFCISSIKGAPIYDEFEEFSCGISDALTRYGNGSVVEDRIMGGVISPPQFWPWLAAVMLPSFSKNESMCTAEIIGDRWVITAKHCSDVLVDGYIHAGNNDVMVVNDETKYEIKNYYVPPGNADIVLVELARNFTYSKDISPVCLSKSLRAKAGDDAIVAGFGTLFIRYDPTERTGVKEEPTHLLHEALLSIEDASECIKKIPGVAGDMKGKYCAGGINRGVMEGDSGGPLMGIENGKFYLWGSVSGGMAFPLDTHGLTVNEIDVYTSVAAHCDWITKMTDGEVECEE